MMYHQNPADKVELKYGKPMAFACVFPTYLGVDPDPIQLQEFEGSTK